MYDVCLSRSETDARQLLLTINSLIETFSDTFSHSQKIIVASQLETHLQSAFEYAKIDDDFSLKILSENALRLKSTFDELKKNTIYSDLKLIFNQCYCQLERFCENEGFAIKTAARINSILASDVPQNLNDLATSLANFITETETNRINWIISLNRYASTWAYQVSSIIFHINENSFKIKIKTTPDVMKSLERSCIYFFNHAAIPLPWWLAKHR